MSAQPHPTLPLDTVAPAGPAPGLDFRTQALRFLITGAISAIVDFGLYSLLFKGLGLEMDLAKAIGFIAGTTTAYVLNRRWTFRAAPSRIRLLAVAALYAVTFSVQLGINNLAYHHLPPFWWKMSAAYVLAQGTATVINFVVQRTVIFKIRP